MKKLLIIAIFIATTITATTVTVTGQEVYQCIDDYLFETGNVTIAYLSSAPEDRGIGFRADINHTYIAMSYGNYHMPYGAYIKDHAKIAMGVVYKNYSVGMAYHSNGETKEIMPYTKQTLKPISIEAGVRVFVGDWFVAALRYDILRHEGMVDFGFLFPR